jgi:hypothetical protein
MASMWRLRLAGVGLMAIGVFVGVASAQVADLLTPSFLRTGLFTVRPGEEAIFSVSLDDGSSGASASVLVQFLNPNGGVVLQQNVRLTPGKSTALPLTTPGRYRAYARVLDAPRLFGARRVVVGTVEVGSDDFVYPTRWVCSIDDSIPSKDPG